MHQTTDIICLVHNQLQITQNFVKHLFDNTQNFNLIFFDNGSEPDTALYLSEGAARGDWQLERSETNLGIITPRNMAAAKYVKSDYFVNLDNDQYVGKNWLTMLHNLMEKDNCDIAGVEGWSLLPPKSGGSVVINDKNYSRAYYPHKRCQRKTDKWTYIGCGGMLIKKKVYDTIGLFDERFSPTLFEDPDFCFRAIQAGFKLGWCHDCPIIHLGSQTSNSNQHLYDKKQQFVISWKKFQDKWNPYFPA